MIWSGFVQNLQTPGGVVYFLHEHRGMPIASPAVFDQIGARFRDGIRRYAQANRIPVVKFRRGDRKVEVMRPRRAVGVEADLAQCPASGRRDRLSYLRPCGVTGKGTRVWRSRSR
jgi:hypothetical protein